MGDAERMISVAELLRREGVGPSEQPAKRGRVAATAAGVVALCGAAVTGIVGFAPTLSTPLYLGDGDGLAQADDSSGGGGVAADDRDGTRSAGTDGGSAFVRTSAERTAARANTEPRTPAMSWLSDDIAADRTTATSQAGAGDSGDAQGGADAERSRPGSAERQSGGTEDDAAHGSSDHGGSRQDDDRAQAHDGADSGGRPEQQQSGSGNGADSEQQNGRAEKRGQSGERGNGQGNENGQGTEDRGNGQGAENGNGQARGNQPEERGNGQDAEERGNGAEHGNSESGKPAHAE